MKHYLLSILAFFALSCYSGFCQKPVLPVNPSSSPLFGKDIVIQDVTGRDQRNVHICSAFNGWLYAVYSYPIGIEQAIAVLKSTDNGITWTLLGEGSMNVASSITKLDMLVCGNSVDNLKIFIAYVYFLGDLNLDGAYVIKYNAEPFYYDDELLKQDGGNIHDMALASDFLYPSVNANPYSIGVLYSKEGVTDTLIFRSSSNGGISLNSRHAIAYSSNYLHKVSLSYGRSPSWSSGRYFAAWEEQSSQTEMVGHIYTSHSEPNFNSAFTSPVCLDCLDLSTLNRVRNPAVSCQSGNNDNDSINLTNVVLFEKRNAITNESDVMGYYNLQSTTTSHYRPLNIAATSNNELQPDIDYNPYNLKFMVTYFDSTMKKLPFLTNDVNLANPDTWNPVSNGYNDNSNLSAPYPKVDLNTIIQDGMNAWISEASGSNGVAMFDSPYSTYTGSSTTNNADLEDVIHVFPNPCNSVLTFAFELTKPEHVTISISDMLGQPCQLITDQYYQKGKSKLFFNVTNLPVGGYTFTFKTGSYLKSGLIIIKK
jgi:hypothetical protein